MFGRKVKNFSLQREDKFSGKKCLDVLRGEIASEMKILHKCFQNSVDQSMEGLEKKYKEINDEKEKTSNKIFLEVIRAV